MIRQEAGDADEGVRLCREAADRGDTGPLWGLAEFREQAGDPDGAARLYREAADRGDIAALERLAVLREQAGGPRRGRPPLPRGC